MHEMPGIFTELKITKNSQNAEKTLRLSSLAKICRLSAIYLQTIFHEYYSMYSPAGCVSVPNLKAVSPNDHTCFEL